MVDGRKAVITKITDLEKDEPFLVYNFEDDFGINNYAVGDGVVVHNSNRDSKGPVEEYTGSFAASHPGRESKIILDSADPKLAEAVRAKHDLFKERVSASRDNEELSFAAGQFSIDLRNELPFLGKRSADEFTNPKELQATTLKYLVGLGKGKKLSVLGSEAKLSCYGQAWTIKKSLPGYGWEVYRDVSLVNGKLVPRNHHFVAKKFGNNYVRVDPTEIYGHERIIPSGRFQQVYGRSEALPCQSTGNVCTPQLTPKSSTTN